MHSSVILGETWPKRVKSLYVLSLKKQVKKYKCTCSHCSIPVHTRLDSPSCAQAVFLPVFMHQVALRNHTSIMSLGCVWLSFDLFHSILISGWHMNIIEGSNQYCHLDDHIHGRPSHTQTSQRETYPYECQMSECIPMYEYMYEYMYVYIYIYIYIYMRSSNNAVSCIWFKHMIIYTSKFLRIWSSNLIISLNWLFVYVVVMT